MGEWGKHEIDCIMNHDVLHMSKKGRSNGRRPVLIPRPYPRDAETSNGFSERSRYHQGKLEMEKADRFES